MRYIKAPGAAVTHEMHIAFSTFDSYLLNSFKCTHLFCSAIDFVFCTTAWDLRLFSTETSIWRSASEIHCWYSARNNKLQLICMWTDS